MLQILLINIQQLVYCSANSVLSVLLPYSYAVSGVVRTLSFEDAVAPEKHIGVFKKRRKAKTNFRRA